MAARSLGGRWEAAHGALVLGALDQLDGGRLVAAARAAQGAEQRPRVVEEDALARQRRAAALVAGVAVAGQGAQSLAQELELEQLGRGHDAGFVTAAAPPADVEFASEL